MPDLEFYLHILTNNYVTCCTVVGSGDKSITRTSTSTIKSYLDAAYDGDVSSVYFVVRLLEFPGLDGFRGSPDG
jgi:hypothetical protein